MPHAQVCCRSGFNCVQRCRASSRSWSTQALATRTLWAQQIRQQEGTEVRRISRAVKSADCLASHNSSQDLHQAVVQMGGMWLRAQLDDYAGFFLQFSFTRLSEVLRAFEGSHPRLAPGHSGFHAMVVGHLSELISTPNGSEKRRVGLRRPASRGGVLINYPADHKWHVAQR